MLGCENTLLPYSGRMDSKSIHSTVDRPPGVSKNQIFFLQIKLLSSCTKIALKKAQTLKIFKIERKKVKKILFS